MGYTTDFTGQFNLDKPLTLEQTEYLIKFCRTRHMKRDAVKTNKRPDPLRKAVGLPIGNEGGYFVNEGGDFGQSQGSDVLDGNKAPSGQPGLWCQWIPGDQDGLPYHEGSDEGEDEGATYIVWDGREKFYEYVAWLKYIIENFLIPWGHNLNGEVDWEGEDFDDLGKIIVKDNIVTTKKAKIVYE